ncbi:hypothetical protein CIB43_00521 [Mesomycoplasma hyopneumoniae]|uniref:Uncharacterized protein n=1 Tax=Mesomycoplasma hyopneumoniae TaxID=2099 RepID=A0A223MAB4_MESHO|nr:hypothetical protein CIB43_00521 [Mesomycoplasma hyopneumoniae]
MFVTRWRTDLIPFDSIFSRLGFKTCANFAKLALNKIVPWWTILFLKIIWALPETFAPLTIKSFRPLNSAFSPKDRKNSIIGDRNFW